MSEVPIPPLLVTLADARRMLSIGKTKLNDLCRNGHLDRQHIGARPVITMEFIVAFVASLKKKTNS